MVEQLVNSEANAQRIAFVESCFGSSGAPLAVPGRVLIGEGELMKMCRKKLKPRQFFLFNDILVYGNIVIRKKKYSKQRLILLEDVKLENLEDNGVLQNGWLLKTPTKSFAVYSATPGEKQEWIAHINKCVQDILKRTGKQPSTESAAVWVPDMDADICMHCRKSQFNLINRRHHCRKCGHVVCGQCSNKKFLLPAQSSKPLRVCLSCFDLLSQERCNNFLRAASSPLPETHQYKSASSSDEESDDEQLNDVTEHLNSLDMTDKPHFYKAISSESTASGEDKVPKESNHQLIDGHTSPSRLGNLI